MIEILKTSDHRPDIVNYCSNCGAIGASHFMACPECGHKPLKKKRIISYEYDASEKQYPIHVICKSLLINYFIPKEVVDTLDEQDMIYIARYIEKCIDYRKFIEGAVKKYLCYKKKKNHNNINNKL